MSRLETVSGTEIIDGDIRLGHLWHEVDAIIEVLKAYEINRFVEVGVHEGGLAWMLLKALPDLHYLGLELNKHLVRPQVLKMVSESAHGEILERNCFDINTILEVQRWMEPDPTLIYCDNGDKPLEVRRYAPILRVGDIIMTHDYYDGKRKVRNLPGYGETSLCSHPEVLPDDVEFMRQIFHEIDKVNLSDTRIIGFIKT